MISTLPSHDDAPLLPPFAGASIWAVLEKPPPAPRYPMRCEGPPPEVRWPTSDEPDNASRR